MWWPFLFLFLEVYSLGEILYWSLSSTTLLHFLETFTKHPLRIIKTFSSLPWYCLDACIVPLENSTLIPWQIHTTSLTLPKNFHETSYKFLWHYHDISSTLPWSSSPSPQGPMTLKRHFLDIIMTFPWRLLKGPETLFPHFLSLSYTLPNHLPITSQKILFDS